MNYIHDVFLASTHKLEVNTSIHEQMRDSVPQVYEHLLFLGAYQIFSICANTQIVTHKSKSPWYAPVSLRIY